MKRWEAKKAIVRWHNLMLERCHRPPEPPMFETDATGQVLKTEGGTLVLSRVGEEALRKLLPYTFERVERAMAHVMLEKGWPSFARVLEVIQEEIKKEREEQCRRSDFFEENAWYVEVFKTISGEEGSCWGKAQSGKVIWYSTGNKYGDKVPKSWLVVEEESYTDANSRIHRLKKASEEERIAIERAVEAAKAEGLLKTIEEIRPLFLEWVSHIVKGGHWKPQKQKKELPF